MVRKNTLILFDIVISHALEWPSLTAHQAPLLPGPFAGNPFSPSAGAFPDPTTPTAPPTSSRQLIAHLLSRHDLNNEKTVLPHVGLLTVNFFCYFHFPFKILVALLIESYGKSEDVDFVLVSFLFKLADAFYSLDRMPSTQIYMFWAKLWQPVIQQQRDIHQRIQFFPHICCKSTARQCSALSVWATM